MVRAAPLRADEVTRRSSDAGSISPKLADNGFTRRKPNLPTAAGISSSSKILHLPAGPAGSVE
jgi:hypothetical protein